jgi:hypothetical protein
VQLNWNDRIEILTESQLFVEFHENELIFLNCRSVTIINGNAAASAFARIAPHDLEKLTSGSSWVSTLIASVHNLPIGFAICNGSINASGFPLIYVNKYFEKMTGDNWSLT